MTYKNIYEKVKIAIEESGVVFSKEDEDPVLSDYFLDSVQYISAIVNIENALDIEIPDEFLLPEQMKTLKSFCQTLEHLINNDEADEDWPDEDI